MSVIDLRNKKPIRIEKERASHLKEKSGEISWQIPEYEYRPKDVSWFWVSLIVAIILFAFSIWQENFLFAVFVVIAFFIINHLSNRFPPIWEIKINEKGIFIGLPNSEKRKFYPMENLESFDIHSEIYENGEEAEYKKLVLKLKAKISPFLKINIYPKDEPAIKGFIAEFAPQEELPKSLTDSLSELIRF
ncbi:MAG: hypothetical protein M1170_00845 [Patescibacteria group bacterium]|nr:hypothetical protein [Patescibacteria group bacterium]